MRSHTGTGAFRCVVRYEDRGGRQRETHLNVRPDTKGLLSRLAASTSHHFHEKKVPTTNRNMSGTFYNDHLIYV